MGIRYYDAVIYHRPHWRNTVTFLTGPKLQRLFLLWLVMAACGVCLRAQSFEGFGPSHEEYDSSGWNPSVAISGSTVVQVNNGSTAPGPMWYQVGLILPGNQILWGPSYQYDNGYNPQVAMFGSTVVEVHNGGTPENLLWYHVGQVSASEFTIKWGPSYPYDTGSNPSVALTSCNTNANPNCGLVAVEVHNILTSPGPMAFHVGLVNVSGSTITWGPSYTLGYDWGFNPSVSIQPCLTDSNTSCGVNVVEVNNSGGSAGTLVYHMGTWPGYSVIDGIPVLFIYWADGVEYDWGWNPKVAFFSGGQVMEVHNGSGSPGPMWYHYGSWSGGTVLDSGTPLNMGGSYEYDSGWNPSVAASGVPGSAVEVHDGSGSAGPMWYHLGSILEIQ
jgi:hypothetical protein